MNNINNYGVTERFITEAAMYPGLQLARVIAQYRGKYRVADGRGEKLAQISGKLRFETGGLTQYPVAGDYVMISRGELSDEAVIHNVLTRKSVFARKAVGVSGQTQLVAANIDTVFLCMSLNQNYSLNRMERYLSIAWDSGATPVVVLTKADLCGDLEGAVREAERISKFSDVIALSMYDMDIAERLAPYFSKNQTCAFIGSSGVGKSTIINRLLGDEDIKTQETGRAGKGRHTTTGREMFPCPLGGVVVDTPGMREMGAESVDLTRAFDDITGLAQVCRFRDCTHTREPGCAVLAAVREGRIDQRRLDSYFKLNTEAGYEGLSSREIEAKKCDRMLKDIGGMKNFRRFIKEQKKR